MSICQCFKDFERKFTTLMLQDIVASQAPETGIQFSYNQVCAHAENDPLLPGPDGEPKEDVTQGQDPDEGNSRPNGFFFLIYSEHKEQY